MTGDPDAFSEKFPDARHDTKGRIYMVVNNYKQSRLKLDIRGVRISLEEILFYTGLILWVSQFYISRTSFAEFYDGGFLTAVRYFCMLLFAVKIVITEKSAAVKAAAVFLVSAAVFVVVQFHINTGMPLIQVLLLVYAAREVSFKKTCKVLLWTCLILWSVPILFHTIGIHQMPREVDNQRVREFLNYQYVSFSSIYFINILFCTLYAYTDHDREGRGGTYAMRRTVPWSVLFMMAVLLMWIYEVTDTSLPFAVSMLCIAAYVLIFKFRLPVLNNTWVNRLLSVSFFPLMAAVNIAMTIKYDSRNAIHKKIDDMTHFRISLAHQGYKNYGINLLGNQIVENTNRAKGRYFYIDSGYIKTLIGYGAIVFIIVLIMYSVMLYAAIIERDRMLAVWLICIALYSVFNNLLLSPSENGTLFALWYSIDLIKWNRHKKKTRKTGTGRRGTRKQIEYGTQS